MVVSIGSTARDRNVAPLWIRKLREPMLAGSIGSEKVMLSCDLAGDTFSSPSSGSLVNTPGRIESTRKAPVESKGTSGFPFPSLRPVTEIEAVPAGVSGVIVSSPLQLRPVNCSCWKSSGSLG